MYEFFLDAWLDDSPVVHDPPAEPVFLTPEELASARERIDYALKFVGNAWTALAFLDDVTAISHAECDMAMTGIGDAPLDALAVCWQRLVDSKPRRTPINVSLDPLMEIVDGPHAAALVAWAGLVELISQRIAPSDWAATWREQRAAIFRYLDCAHAEMRAPLLVTTRIMDPSEPGYADKLKVALAGAPSKLKGRRRLKQ
jgi:hypothetical protein